MKIYMICCKFCNRGKTIPASKTLDFLQKMTFLAGASCRPKNAALSSEELGCRRRLEKAESEADKPRGDGTAPTWRLRFEYKKPSESDARG